MFIPKISVPLIIPKEVPLLGLATELITTKLLAPKEVSVSLLAPLGVPPLGLATELIPPLGVAVPTVESKGISSSRLGRRVSCLIILVTIPVVNSGNIDSFRNRWDDGVLIYEVDSSLFHRIDDIIVSMDIIRQNTRIDFLTRTFENDYVVFRLGGGCSSFVGRIGGGQTIRLADGCPIASIIHEICHALGCYHEHTRPDRDFWVTIHTDKIISSTLFNFEISVTASAVGPYDYESLMHYHSRAFSIDNSVTIETINPPNTPIGQRNRMSLGDIDTFNALAPEPTVLPPPPPICSTNCTSHGMCIFVNDDPVCVCDNGYVGEHCEVSLCNPECLNEGICIEPPSNCTCYKEYYGDHCQFVKEKTSRFMKTLSPIYIIYITLFIIFLVYCVFASVVCLKSYTHFKSSNRAGTSSTASPSGGTPFGASNGVDTPGGLRGVRS